MAGAHNGLNIFILDACRTNPFDPNGAHGLSRIDSNASLFVSYATSPGAVALDGAGHNSPYTKYLSEWIATPNLSIEDTFKRTLKGVYVDTHGAADALDLIHFLRRLRVSPRGRRGRSGGRAGWSGGGRRDRGADAHRRLSRERHQPERQQLYRHRRPQGGRRGFQADLVDRQGRVSTAAAITPARCW